MPISVLSNLDFRNMAFAVEQDDRLEVVPLADILIWFSWNIVVDPTLPIPAIPATLPLPWRAWRLADELTPS